MIVSSPGKSLHEVWSNCLAVCLTRSIFVLCFVGCLMSVWELLCVRIYLRWFIIKMVCFLFFFFFGFVGTNVLSFFLPISSVLMLEQCRSICSWWNGAVAATDEDYFRFDWDQRFSCHSTNLTCLQRRIPTLLFRNIGKNSFWFSVVQCSTMSVHSYPAYCQILYMHQCVSVLGTCT